MSKKIITFIMTVALLMVPLLSGCNQADEKPSTAETVKTFKVGKKGGAETAAGEIPAQSNEVKVPQVPVAVGAPSDDKAGQAPVVISEKASEEMLYGKVYYNPAGRLDPFEPLFSKRASASPDAVGVANARPTARQTRLSRLTPLEKLDISQLKLVGVVRTPDRSMGMVEEAGGKGYVIRKGSYIGVNSGQVVEIIKDRVVIEEEVENFLGKIVVRTRELKLQKPLGEE